jgi:hypothetical protein
VSSLRNSETSFIIQFPLIIERFQEDVLNKRMEIGRKIYNSLVTVTRKRYNEMIKTKLYRYLMEQLRELKENKENQKRKQIIAQLDDLRTQYRINEYAFHQDVKTIQHHFNTNIDSFTAQKIATRLWVAYDKLLFGDGEAVHYRKYGTFNSLEGKSNGTGIRFKDDCLLWNGLILPVSIDYDNLYEAMSMKNKIAYCRIVRKYVRNRYKFYLQIIFKGTPPPKINKETDELKHQIGNGDVGIDIGTQTVAISSKTDVKIYELANRVQNIENEKRFVQRKMDRSKRANNPDNFNADGTIKKQGNKKVKWVRSNIYLKLQGNLKELYRKQADVRKLQHEIMANHIISLGNKVYVETMNFKGLQKRAKKTEKNEKGKFKRKKRFGKSIANKAPAMLLEIVDRKLKSYGTQLYKVNTWSVKASQYNHVEDINKKKKLSQRWNEIDGKKIQRDMYSAFLIMNVNDSLSSIDKTKCDERYKNFLKLHDKEVQRLKGNKNLSSIAI